MRLKNCNKCRACYVNLDLDRQTACELGYDLVEGPRYILNGSNFQSGTSTLYHTCKCPKPTTLNQIESDEVVDLKINNIQKCMEQDAENSKIYIEQSVQYVYLVSTSYEPCGDIQWFNNCITKTEKEALEIAATDLSIDINQLQEYKDNCYCNNDKQRYLKDSMVVEVMRYEL